LQKDNKKEIKKVESRMITKSIKKKGIVSLFLMFLAVMVLGCGSEKSGNKGTGSDGSTAKIGVVSYLTGAGAAYGESIRQGLELARDEVNAQGKVKLELIFEDSKGEKNEAINAVNKLIHKDNVLSLIGPTLSGEMFAVGPIVNQEGVPIMGTSLTVEGITEIGDYVFRNSLPDSAAIPQSVKKAKEKFNLKKVAIMYSDNNDLAVSGFKIFEKTLKENGVEVIAVETFADKNTDFSAQLTKIATLNPDAIMVAGLYQEAALILKKAREIGITVPVVGNNGFNSPQLIKSAGNAADGAIVASPWFPGKDDAKVKSFIAAYKAKYNKEPDQFAAQAYDALQIMAIAIEKTGSVTDRQKLRDALATVKDYSGVTGKFAFDEKRNPAMDVTVLVVKDGQFTELK
jgi:branched-chain amino acid transport system substrate-binding protein